jgi:hypothetical protein
MSSSSGRVHDVSRPLQNGGVIYPGDPEMMRHGFGGHPSGQDEAIRLERKTGRVGGWPSGAAEGP